MKWVWIGLVVVIIYLFLAAISTASEQQYLTRSIYVPIAFCVCDHLTDAIFYQEEIRIGMLPIERTFQFTWYPKLEGWFPESTEVQIKGFRTEDGSAFLGRIAITAEGIFTSKKAIELDTEWARKKLKYKRDVKYKITRLFIRHNDDCDQQRSTDKQKGK